MNCIGFEGEDMRASRFIIIISFLIISASSSPAFAQDKCTLKEAPEVRGFKLGQTYNSLVDRFPSAFRSLLVVAINPIKDTDDVGMSSLDLNGAALNDDEKGKFSDVSQVKLRFLKDDKGEFPQNRIVSIEINYDPTIEWKDNLEFTSIVADSLHLPRRGWLGRDQTVLRCDGFNVETSSEYWGKLKIEDNKLAEELIRRRKELERRKQQRREAFKP